MYQLDPNNPESRYTGNQVVQAFGRARQYDQMQGQLHTVTTENESLRQALATSEAQRKESEERDRIATYIQELGFGQPNPATQPPVESFQPSGQQPVAGGAADDFLLEFGNGGNATPGTPPGVNPAQQPGTPAAPDNTALLSDPRRLVSVISALTDDGNKKLLAELSNLLPRMVEDNVARRFEQQARQDRVKSQFSSARAQLSEEMLSKWGIPEERAKDILDKMYMSLASNEEASRIYNASYENTQAESQAHELARQKVAEGNQLFSSALTDAITSGYQGREQRQAQEAAEMLETGGYANLGELEQPNREIYDPAEIEKIVQQNYEKSVELAETQNRLQNTVGGNVQVTGT